MKIKIIELLNRIANGKEVPNKIKHWKTEYQKLDDDTFIQYRNKNGYCLDLVQILNDEVEIIEEDKTIKSENEIENLEELGIKIGQMYKELIGGITKGFEEEQN